MTEPYGYRPNQPVVWFHRQFRRSNQFCLYCARYVADGKIPSNKEHLIGTSFVPDGAFDGGTHFNFIFRGCVACNTGKSNLERHVSSVTLYNSPARSEPDIDKIAARKASKDFHPIQKGKLVCESHHTLSFDVASPIPTEFSFTGPPLLEERWTKLLAFHHIQGFFSLVTTSDPLQREKLRLLPPRQFWYGGHFLHTDWGSDVLVELARRVREWPSYVDISTANGFFKAVLKRDDVGSKQWFWALEWNKNVRTVGGIADPERQPLVFDDLPELAWNVISPTLRYRLEQPAIDGRPDFFADS